MLHGGYRFTFEEVGRLMPGEISDLVAYDRLYSHNAAGIVAYQMRRGLGMTRRNF